MLGQLMRPSRPGGGAATRGMGTNLSIVVVVQSLSHVRLFVTPWTATRQASLTFTVSWSLLKLMSIELVMPSNHLILCFSLLLLPPIFPSIRVFSNELALCIRWLVSYTPTFVPTLEIYQFSFRICV